MRERPPRAVASVERHESPIRHQLDLKIGKPICSTYSRRATLLLYRRPALKCRRGFAYVHYRAEDCRLQIRSSPLEAKKARDRNRRFVL